MAEKVTTMRLKVDLQCVKCYKKVKKVLCKFPQIRDQMYDDKKNIVTIKVACCNPEKIRDKLCCKGCGFVKSIEIEEHPPAKPPGLPPPPPPPPPQQQQQQQVISLVLPCFYGYGRPPPCYCGCYGRPYYVSRCDEYFWEDNTSSCSVM